MPRRRQDSGKGGNRPVHPSPPDADRTTRRHIYGMEYSACAKTPRAHGSGRLYGTVWRNPQTCRAAVPSAT